MDKEERRKYHKQWRESTDREKFLEGQRRRSKKWYYANLEKTREQKKLAMRKSRAKNPEKYRAYIRERWRVQSRRNRRFVNAYKFTCGCVDCGQTNPVVLDFHHVRGKKRLRITNMANWGWSLMTIIAEIEKCEVLCSNCHRIRHNDIVSAG